MTEPSAADAAMVALQEQNREALARRVQRLTWEAENYRRAGRLHVWVARLTPEQRDVWEPYLTAVGFKAKGAQ